LENIFSLSFARFRHSPARGSHSVETDVQKGFLPYLRYRDNSGKF
jgi:hypothetical protein